MILFVDDDFRGMKPYHSALEEAGYKVRTAGSPDDALAIIEHEEQKVELVILDIFMPYGTRFGRGDTHGGLETGHRLLEYLQLHYPRCPVVVFSINNFTDLRTQYQGRNVFFLGKSDTLPSELVVFLGETFRDFARERKS